jgi:hypothetical protein
MDKSKALQDLEKLYFQDYPEKSKKQNQEDVHNFWREIKNKANWIVLYDEKVEYLKKRLARRKLDFLLQFGNPGKPPVRLNNPENVTVDSSTSTSTSCSGSSNSTSSTPRPSNSTESSTESASTTPTQKPNCPKQNEVEVKLALVNGDLCGLLLRESSGQLTADQTKLLKKLKQEKKDLEEQMRKLVGNQKNQLNFRRKRNAELRGIAESDPEARKKLRLRDSVGHPRLEIE